MAATAQSGKRGDDLVGGTPFDLTAAQTGKGRTRVPEILLGTFLVALFALAGAWFYSTSTASTGYISLRTDVQRGQEIEAIHLDVIEISTTDEGLRAVPWSERQTIIGRLARVDMQAGTLVTVAQFTDRADIAEGFGIVGLSLDIGEFPTSGLRAGDWVRVVAMPVVPAEPNPPADVLAERVQVAAISDEGGSRFVSLAVDTETADVVAAVESQGRIRLIQVPDAEVEDAEPAEADAAVADEGDDG